MRDFTVWVSYGEMAEKWGHKVLPLAPYSPELNPIEKGVGEY